MSLLKLEQRLQVVYIYLKNRCSLFYAIHTLIICIHRDVVQHTDFSMHCMCVCFCFEGLCEEDSNESITRAKQLELCNHLTELNMKSTIDFVTGINKASQFGINKTRHPLVKHTVRVLRLVPQYVVVPNSATRTGFVN